MRVRVEVRVQQLPLELIDLVVLEPKSFERDNVGFEFLFQVLTSTEYEG